MSQFSTNKGNRCTCIRWRRRITGVPILCQGPLGIYDVGMGIPLRPCIIIGESSVEIRSQVAER